MAGSKKPYPLFDALLVEMKKKTDAELAGLLGVGAPQLCRIRAGDPLTDFVRVRILRNTKMTLKRIDQLSPPADKVKS